jgi:hypothetical protein
MAEEIEIDGHKYEVEDESFPLTLTKPFMHGDNSLLVQKYLNQVYNAGLREHGIYGHATSEAVKKNLEIEEVTEERFVFIQNFNFK